MEITLSLIPVAGAFCLLASILEGWILALMRYMKVGALKKVFSGYQYLVRSHVDYVIMAVLLVGIYLVLVAMDISISKTAIVALIIGAFYDPFGFLLQAVKPGIAESDSRIIKMAILIGFVPATYGFGAVALAIIFR